MSAVRNEGKPKASSKGQKEQKGQRKKTERMQGKVRNAKEEKEKKKEKKRQKKGEIEWTVEGTYLESVEKKDRPILMVIYIRPARPQEGQWSRRRVERSGLQTHQPRGYRQYRAGHQRKKTAVAEKRREGKGGWKRSATTVKAVNKLCHRFARLGQKYSTVSSGTATVYSGHETAGWR